MNIAQHVNGKPGVIVGIIRTPRDRRLLGEALAGNGWKLELCDRLAAARPFLPDASVVLCDDRLPDGNWQDLLARLEQLPLDPPLIVASRLADERLWAEVLNLGGYDLLAEPFRPEEVIRTVKIACEALPASHPALPPAVRSTAPAKSPAPCLDGAQYCSKDGRGRKECR